MSPPIPDTDEEANRMYEGLMGEIHKRQLSNSQEKDKAILMLATAMLGVSLTFIDRLVKMDVAVFLWLLEVAWLGFVLSILSTLLSFHASQFGLDRLMVQARRYYIDKDESAYKEPNRGRTWTVWLNGIATTTFAIAVFVLVAFIWKNIPRR